MIPNKDVTVSLTSELRLEQALGKTCVKKPASVKRLTVKGIFVKDDFHYIQTKMRRTLQELDLKYASIEKNEIPSWALNHCSGLVSVILPSSVTKIGKCAFWKCSALTTITIPDSVTEVGADVFFDCAGITSNTSLPESADDTNNNEKQATKFNNLYNPQSWLAKYFPENSLEEVTNLLQLYSIHLKVTKPRRSVLGTYISPSQRNYHTITVNGDVNKWEFLEIFLHEYAHLLVQVNCNYYARSHGIEWKNYCRDLYHHFIRKNIFPKDISIALQQYMIKMQAKATANLAWVLAKYGNSKDNYVEKFDYCCN
jgi:hypothetical protein